MASSSQSPFPSENLPKFTTEQEIQVGKAILQGIHDASHLYFGEILETVLKLNRLEEERQKREAKAREEKEKRREEKDKHTRDQDEKMTTLIGLVQQIVNRQELEARAARDRAEQKKKDAAQAAEYAKEAAELRRQAAEQAVEQAKKAAEQAKEAADQEIEEAQKNLNEARDHKRLLSQIAPPTTIEDDDEVDQNTTIVQLEPPNVPSASGPSIRETRSSRPSSSKRAKK